MLEERVAAIEAKLRDLESLNPIREAVAERKAEADKAAADAQEAATKEAEEKQTEGLAKSRAAAEAAAVKRGYKPPDYYDAP